MASSSPTAQLSPDEELLANDQSAQDLGPGEAVTATNWEAVVDRLESIKMELDWENTTGVARDWWEEFEEENSGKLPLVIALAEELKQRDATIKEFFLAYLESDTDSIDGNLAYMSEMKQDSPKKEVGEKSKPTSSEKIAELEEA